MKTKAPPTRRKFAHDWDEIDYLYHKLLYWLYDRRKESRALPFAERLDRLLAKVPLDQGEIRAEECRSLICEAKQDLRGAIRHRECEIRLIHRLLELSLGAPSRDFVLRHYDYSDLSDRLDLLAILYRASGDLHRAIRTLRESKRLCEDHGIPFDGQDLLDDYLRETKGTYAAAAHTWMDHAGTGK